MNLSDDQIRPDTPGRQGMAHLANAGNATIIRSGWALTGRGGSSLQRAVHQERREKAGTLQEHRCRRRCFLDSRWQAAPPIPRSHTQPDNEVRCAHPIEQIRGRNRGIEQNPAESARGTRPTPWGGVAWLQESVSSRRPVPELEMPETTTATDQLDILA